MFKSLGKIKNLIKKQKTKLQLNQLNEETNLFDNFIIYKKKNNIKIYNRICDHRGGKIISRGSETICPIHDWKFNPETGFYDNGIKKREIDYSVSNKVIEFDTIKYKPEIHKYSQKNNKTKIRFFNHAFLKIEGNNYSFSTDPWAIGPAFNTGWWLKNLTKNDWVQNLNNSNFIYISHNHPDHLHPLTLSKVDKNITIVVPNFQTDSTGKYIEDLGFKNILRLDFNTQYNLTGTELILCIFKSGDFREDSGIYFSNGNFTSMLGVDSNLLNFERYPNVDLYANSFAGGASGYPLMFENYKHNERIKIANKDKIFLRKKNYDTLKKISPSYFLPYAGFFEEKLKRDIYVKKYNQKNSIKDYLQFCNKNNIKLLNVEKYDSYTFKGGKLISSNNIYKEKTRDLKQKTYLEYFKKEYEKTDEKYFKNYFIKSGFKDNLHLYILLTDDKFRLLGENYFIDFSKNKIIFNVISNFQKKRIQSKSINRKLVLKVRKESFLNTIYNKLPWEDLSIGFQCKVLRNPNVYSINFWHHFTNTYTTSKNVRSKTNCGACTKLSQFFDNEIYSSI